MDQALTIVKSEPLPALSIIKSEPAAPSSPASPQRTAIQASAANQLQRTDLPDSVRKELEDVRDGKSGSGDEILNALTPHGAHAILSGLLAPVRAWGDAGPHRVVTGLREVAAGNLARGAHDAIVGAGVTAAPMVAPALLESLAAAPAATAAATAGTVAAGTVGSAMARGAAKVAGASDDQANLAGDVAGLGASAAMVKAGIPALAKWSANNRALAMGKSYIQSTRDIQAALGVNAEDVHRARPFLEAVHANGIPIVGKEDAAAQLVKASDVAIDEIEQHVGSLVQKFPNASVPASTNAIVKRIAQMPGSSPADLAAARKVIAEYGLNQPRSLAEAESLRIRLNAENRSILEGSGVKQRTAVLTNATYVARQEAANQLRDGIYGTLEQNGVQGIRDLRLSEGAISKIRNAADPLTRGLRSESTVARTGETSFGRRLAQRVAPMIGAGAGAVVSGGNPIVAATGAELGGELTAGLTSKNLSKNALLERAFQQSFTSPPVMSVQGFRAPSASPKFTPALLPSHTPAALPSGRYLPAGD